MHGIVKLPRLSIILSMTLTPTAESISFFCPAYHDEKNLPILIPKVHAFLKRQAGRFEIIIVEDGSPDRTDEVADELARTYPEVRVIHHETNTGYGGALKDGFKNARYDLIMYTDGDNQYDIDEMAVGLELMRQGADVASGYVIEKAVNTRRKIQSWVYNTLILILFGLRIRDVDCSMKIYRRSILDKMRIVSSSAFIDAEMLVKAKRAGALIRQFPVHHFARLAGIAGGSKLRVIIPTVVDMCKFRLGML